MPGPFGFRFPPPQVGQTGKASNPLAHLLDPVAPTTPVGIDTAITSGDTAYGAGGAAHWAANNVLNRPNAALNQMYADTGIAGKVSRMEGGLGTVLGGISVMNGIDEISHGKTGQGALDLTAGGLGIAGGLQGLGLIGSAGAMGAIGPAGVIAGLIADGNGYTQQHGWWGQNADGTNKDSISWDIDRTAAAARQAHDGTTALTGSKTLGDLAGLASGIQNGIGNTVIAAGGDLVGGVIDTGETLAGAAAGVGRFYNEMWTNPAQAMTDAGNFAHSAWDFGAGVVNTGANVLGGIGNGISNFQQSMARDPLGTLGGAASTAANAVGGVLNGAANVGGNILNGAANIAGGFASDVASDASNVVGGIGNAVGGLLSW